MNLTHPSVRLLIAECSAQGLLRNQCAYVLGTAWHETGAFKYMREIWGPTGAQKRYEGRKDLGNTVAGDGKKFLGRGFVQITGRRNYTDWGKRMVLDLVKEPQLAEKPEVAVKIIVAGMRLGTFTGKKLADYVTLQKSDFYNARAIVNGDKAKNGDLIAGYAKKFDALLIEAGYGSAPTANPDTTTVSAPKEPIPAPTGWFASLLAAIAAFFTKGK